MDACSCRGRLIAVVRGQTPAPLKTPLASLSRPDVVGFDRICPLPNSPSLGSFGVPVARGWTETSRFRWKTSVGRSTCPGRRWASIGSSGIGIPGNRKKTCASSRETESSRRSLARLGFPHAGREKKCLPPPRPRGRMTLRRLADGRPAAQRSQTTAAHEPNDAREAGGDGVRNGKISGPRPGGRNRYILETEWRLECGR
jgi:hypothetical protein